jgi:hypothetical protein
MTETTLLDPVEEQIDLTLGGTFEIGINAYAGHPTVHLDVEDACVELTASDALRVVAGIMRAVDTIGSPEPGEPVDAPAPVVVTRVLPGDLIFVGMPR